MALVAAEMNTKQNSNASLVQETMALGVIRIRSQHFGKTEKNKSPPDVSVKHRMSCFVSFSNNKNTISIKKK